jgi:hypothetical protein
VQLRTRLNNSIAVVKAAAIFYIGDDMEKRTFYIHKSKNDHKSYMLNQDHRVVNFIGGNQDILEIIKKLIKNKCNS